MEDRANQKNESGMEGFMGRNRSIMCHSRESGNLKGAQRKISAFAGMTRMIGAAAILCMVGMSTPTPAHAEPFTAKNIACADNLSATAKRNYEEAKKQHTLQDEHGSIAGQLYVYEKAANAGHPDAIARYGFTLFGLYYTNEAPQSVNKAEYVKALTYIFIAAEKGDKEAVHFRDEMLVRKTFDDMPSSFVKAAQKQFALWKSRCINVKKIEC
jgi:TPR repeat protein